MINFLSSIQPYFVLNTTAYYKRCMYSLGISHFYEFVCDCADSPDTIVVPDGTIDVIFSCDPFGPEAFAYGSVLSAANQMFDIGRRYFGVRFLPGAVIHFGEVSAVDIVASAIPLTELKGMGEAVGRIAEAADFEKRIAIFMDTVLPLIGINSESADTSGILAGKILSEINLAHGTLTMKDLESDLYYSGRHMNRVFLANTGFTIKRFSRYVRFQNLLAILKERGNITVLEAAEEAGYYDQNHLQKEFHEFAMTTPNSFRELIKEERYPDRIIKK